MTPKISVVMPLYNAERHLRQAMESVLAQTFTDFELIIIDDCSTDTTPAILDSFDDARIVRLKNAKNLGIVGALNRGLDTATGQYIARMDGDDICFSDRFKAQVAYLDSHPEVGLLGTKYVHIDDEGNFVFNGVEMPPPPEPSTPGYLKWSLLWMTTIQHPSAMIRREILQKYQLRYVEAYVTAEDYELWTQINRYAVVARLPEVYLQYRVNPQGISTTKRERQLKTHYDIMHRELCSFMGCELSVELTLFLFRMVIPQDLNPHEIVRGVDLAAAVDLFLSIRQRFVDTYSLLPLEQQHLQREIIRIMTKIISYSRASTSISTRLKIRAKLLKESPSTFAELTRQFMEYRLRSLFK